MSIGDPWRWLRFFLRRDRAMAELDEEMRLHLELRERAEREGGRPAAEAGLAARRRFGNRLALREESREAWGLGWIDRLTQDVRYALRQLRRQKRATVIAALTLALGIGANTSMFTLLEAALFRSPAAVDPDRLVWIVGTSARGDVRQTSYPDYLGYRDRTAAFSDVAAFAPLPFALGGGTPERVKGQIATGNYFDALGVRAQIGRVLRPADDRATSEPVVVLSDSLWRRRFAADRAIAGKTIVLNGKPFVVIGVAPAGFDGLELGEETTALWVATAMQPQLRPDDAGFLTDQTVAWLQVFARLAPGVSLEQARSAAILVARQAASSRADAEGAGADVLRIVGGLDPANRRDAAPIFALLAAVPALVLLVACANVANLLLARAIDRRKELAMRRALGATRSRLIRQLLTESLVLAIVAGAAGVLVSYALTAAVVAAAAVPGAITSALTVNPRVLVATFLLSLATTVLCGLAPALAGSKPALAPSLKDDGVSLTQGRRRHRLRNIFVIGQVTVSLVLLVVAGLFLQSLAKALHVSPGFDARRVATLSFDLGLQGYGLAAREAFRRRVLDAVAATAGVDSAALADVLPLSGRMYGTGIAAAGSGQEEQPVHGNFANVTAGYFRTMGIDLVRGRDFTPQEVSASAPLAIVNHTLAQRLWPGEEPIGKRLRAGGSDQPVREVIGVARDGKYDSLNESTRGFVYLPQGRSPLTEVALVVRASGDPGRLLGPLREIVHALDPNLPVFRASTLSEAIRGTLDKQRAASALLGVFGVVTLALASLGIYGVMAHSVTMRTREIGIRMSLGARASDVSRMVVRDGMRLSIVGVAIGLVFSGLIAAALGAFLFGLEPADAAAFVSASALLCAVAVLASYLPARRAARVDPLVALRYE